MTPVRIYKVEADPYPENPFNSSYRDRCTKFVAAYNLEWFFRKVENATVVPVKEYDLNINDYAFYVYENEMEEQYPILQSFWDQGRYGLECDLLACEVFAKHKLQEQGDRALDDRGDTSWDYEVSQQQREVFDEYVGKWVSENLKVAQFPSQCFEGKECYIFLDKLTAEEEGILWDSAQAFVDAELEELVHWCAGEVYGYTCYEGDLSDELLAELPTKFQVVSTEGLSCFVVNEYDWGSAFTYAEEELEETDSCGGFYGLEGIRQEVESLAKQQIKEVVSET